MALGRFSHYVGVSCYFVFTGKCISAYIVNSNYESMRCLTDHLFLFHRLVKIESGTDVYIYIYIMPQDNNDAHYFLQINPCTLSISLLSCLQDITNP